MTFGAWAYIRKSTAYTSTTKVVQRVKTIETQGGTTTFTPLAQPTITQELDFQFQATQFAGALDKGDARIYANTAPSTIDEETLASVAAYARFDDVGGSGTASLSPFASAVASFTPASFTDASFTSSLSGTTGDDYRIPMEDNEGKTAFYHGSWRYVAWNPHLHPEVTHTKQFMTGNSVELNVPGINADDRNAFCYYITATGFWNTHPISFSLWFYPTDLSTIASETWRTLIYRQGGGDYYAVVIKSADSKVYVFNNETGVLTKLVTTGTVTANAWNNIIVTYDSTPNTLVIYLNGSSASSIPSDTYTPLPYTADDNTYLGGLPVLPNKRFTGYLDNFVFWDAKVLSAGEASNMWTRGTIV